MRAQGLPADLRVGYRPRPEALSVQGGSTGRQYVKNDFGAEQEIKRCHACGMEEMFCGFSRQMWHKPQGVRVCRVCMEHLKCASCDQVKRPKHLSQTQICRLRRHRTNKDGGVAVWGRRCNECLGLQVKESREMLKQKVFAPPKPLPADSNSDDETESDGEIGAAWRGVEGQANVQCGKRQVSQEEEEERSGHARPQQQS